MLLRSHEHLAKQSCFGRLTGSQPAGYPSALRYVRSTQPCYSRRNAVITGLVASHRIRDNVAFRYSVTVTSVQTQLAATPASPTRAWWHLDASSLAARSVWCKRSQGRTSPSLHLATRSCTQVHRAILHSTHNTSLQVSSWGWQVRQLCVCSWDLPNNVKVLNVSHDAGHHAAANP